MTCFISCKDAEIASLNNAVDVSGQENFDSIPNLIISAPAKSAEPKKKGKGRKGGARKIVNGTCMTRVEYRRRTVDTIPIMVQCAKSCSAEILPSTQSAGTELPLLTPRENFILEERRAFARFHHEPQA